MDRGSKRRGRRTRRDAQLTGFLVRAHPGFIISRLPVATLVAEVMRFWMSDMDVLLVEDDRSLATVMEEALIASGHCVQVARSVPEAYDALVHAHRFQAILLDLRLGTERGEAIFLRLRALRVSYPPVIILSAQPHAEIAEMARLIGAAKWLTKPASMAAVNAALEQVLRDIH